ncbi:MAG: TfoX/Sxy family protein [bacterium]
MFGGYGLFRHSLMFGLIANGSLYLKTDSVNRSEFESLGLNPFLI